MQRITSPHKPPARTSRTTPQASLPPPRLTCGQTRALGNATRRMPRRFRNPGHTTYRISPKTADLGTPVARNCWKLASPARDRPNAARHWHRARPTYRIPPRFGTSVHFLGDPHPQRPSVRRRYQLRIFHSSATRSKVMEPMPPPSASGAVTEPRKARRSGREPARGKTRAAAGAGDRIRPRSI